MENCLLEGHNHGGGSGYFQVTTNVRDVVTECQRVDSWQANEQQVKGPGKGCKQGHPSKKTT